MLERQRKQLSKLQKQNKIEEFIVKVLYIIFFILYNIFEIWLVYLIGKYSNKLYELGLILVCFFINKAIYGKPLHFRDNFLCLGVSLALFYVAIKSAFTLELSIMANVMIGVMCGCLTSYIATYLYNENKKLSNRQKIINILDGNVTKDNILHYCRNNGIKEDVVNTIDAFLNKTINEICEEQYLTENAVKKRIRLFIESASK